MINTMFYLGYNGSVEYSDADEVLHGKILDVDDLITYEGRSVSELKKEFQSAVDDYIQTKHPIEKCNDLENNLWEVANYFSTQEKAEEINKKQTLCTLQLTFQRFWTSLFLKYKNSRKSN